MKFSGDGRDRVRPRAPFHGRLAIRYRGSRTPLNGVRHLRERCEAFSVCFTRRGARADCAGTGRSAGIKAMSWSAVPFSVEG